MAYLRSMPDATLIDVFKAYPEISGPLHHFAEALMRGPSPLSAGDRELIAAYVSGLNGCEFCHDAHAAAATRLGVENEVVRAVLDDVEAAPVTEKLRPLLRYVRKLNDTPDRVSRADVEAVYEAGWDERALVHATLVCGFFNLMNRWVDGLGIPADSDTAAMAGEMLERRGYKFIAEMLET